ncbi:MAG: hypothetical protein AAF787_19555 [Chloroflexota bacterium]
MNLQTATSELIAVTERLLTRQVIAVTAAAPAIDEQRTRDLLRQALLTALADNDDPTPEPVREVERPPLVILPKPTPEKKPKPPRKYPAHTGDGLPADEHLPLFDRRGILMKMDTHACKGDRVRFHVYQWGELIFTHSVRYEGIRARDPRPIIQELMRL